jgi:hypothetical protein
MVFEDYRINLVLKDEIKYFKKLKRDKNGKIIVKSKRRNVK